MFFPIALMRLWGRGQRGLQAPQIFEVLGVGSGLAVSLDAGWIFPLPAFAMSIGKRKICSPAVAMLRTVLPEIGGFPIEQIDAILDAGLVFIQENENAGRIGIQLRIFED